MGFIYVLLRIICMGLFDEDECLQESFLLQK